MSKTTAPQADVTAPGYRWGRALAQVHIDFWNASVPARLREHEELVAAIHAGARTVESGTYQWVRGFTDTLRTYVDSHGGA